MSKKQRPTPLWWRLLGGLFYVLFLSVVLLGSTTAGWIGQSEVAKEVVVQLFRPKPPEEVFEGKDSITLLVLGCDEDLYYGGHKAKKLQRLNAAARADMILVAKLDFKNNRISGVSIPRDLRCELPGYYARKINAYHADAPKGQGAELMRTAVEYTLPGVAIDKVVTLDYEAFQRLVDLVGGIPVKVERRMKYTDNAGGIHIDLKPGKHVLDGYTAMCYVRYRKGDRGVRSETDFTRQERQKEFLLAFKKAALAKPTLLNQVADEAKNVLGKTLTVEEVVALAMFGRRVPSTNIKLGMVPVEDIHDGSYDLRLIDSRLEETLVEFGLRPGVPPSDSRVSTRR